MRLIITHVNPILIRLRYALLAGVLFLGMLAFFQALLQFISIDLRIHDDLIGTIVPFVIAASVSLALFIRTGKEG